jgi:transcriptional regulator with XRE-family HTH domain
MAPSPELAAAIRARRQSLGFTQCELAERAGMHTSTIGRYERAERDLRLTALLRLARAFGIPLSELLTDAESSRERRARST